MRGSVFKLNIKGIQDEFLVGNPTINFLSQMYKRHVNFNIESTKLYSKDTVNFGKKFSFVIKNAGDMINKMYFCFSLPTLTSTSGTYAGWTNSLGNAVIKDVELVIGNITIDKRYGLLMEIWHELTNKNTLGTSTDKMVGRYQHLPLLTVNADSPTSYTVPLSFWFCNDISSSFPLVALYNQEMVLTFSLRDFEECIVYDGNTPPVEVAMNDSYLLADCLYLEDEQRNYLRLNKSSYIINQAQYIESQSLGTSGTNNFDATFNNPVYEILFVARELSSDQNNDWFNFSKRNNVINTPVVELISSAKLILDGVDNTDTYINSNILNTVYTNRYHTNTTDKHIYVMSFCDKPENNTQPTGFLNFSAIDNAVLSIKTNGSIPAANLHTFALNWNWIYIEKGCINLKFLS